MSPTPTPRATPNGVGQKVSKTRTPKTNSFLKNTNTKRSKTFTTGFRFYQYFHRWFPKPVSSRKFVGDQNWFKKNCWRPNRFRKSLVKACIDKVCWRPKTVRQSLLESKPVSSRKIVGGQNRFDKVVGGPTSFNKV